MTKKLFINKEPKSPVAEAYRTLRTNIHFSSIDKTLKSIVITSSGATGMLWIRDLDQREARRIEGTAGAVAPIWSPDSEFVAFALGGEIRKVSSQGGDVVRVCDLAVPGHHETVLRNCDGGTLHFGCGGF